MPTVRIGPLKKGSLMGYRTKDSQARRRQILSIVVLSKEKPCPRFANLGRLWFLQSAHPPKLQVFSGGTETGSKKLL